MANSVIEQTDVEYWDSVAKPEEDSKENCIYLKTNHNKSRIILREILKHDLTDMKLLEIGCGSACIGAALRAIYLGHMKYIGCDISQNFLDVASKVFGLKTKYGRITELPFADNFFDCILMFDVFEHIRPEEREKAGQEIKRVLKSGGMLIMNSPMMESLHDKNFDFGLEKKDIENLMKNAGLEKTKIKIIHYSTDTDPLRAYIYEEFKKA